jgi:phage terminase large subunit GpA-like protein
LLAEAARVKPLRSLRQFAEDEIILPSGPFEGQPFRVSRQPIAGLLLDALMEWRRTAITGPGQDGKSLVGYVILLLYYLFETSEDVILGVPNEDIASDKWRDDIRPVIEASRYRALLPRRGSGSRGGKVKAIQFRNGRVLRFMSGGGRDKSKAGKTSRVVLITETDGMDTPQGGSKEADPIRQIEARTKAFADTSRTHLECTVSTEQGRIWKEYSERGTASRIEVPCPHCGEWIQWERKHLVGWQDAKTILEAAKNARMACPSCGGLCDDAQRREAIRSARLVHTKTDTDTLGFRWTAAQSYLKNIGEIAKDEWTAAQSDDLEADKALNQFTWAIPVKPEKISLSETDWSKIAQRQGAEKRGFAPADTDFLTAAMDLQAESAYWSLLAWSAAGSARTVDYGVLDVPSRELGQRRGIALAVRDFYERIVKPGLHGVPVKRAIVDAGNWQADVVAACSDFYPQICPAKGFGESQVRADRDMSQTGYEPVKLDTGDVLIELLADYWKTQVHDAWRIDVDKPGALTLFHVDKSREHLAFVKHQTAERQVSEYIPGKGNKTRWEMIAQHRPNHWLDSTAMAFAARQIELDYPTHTPVNKSEPKTLTTPDGRPFLITQRT